MIVRPRQQNQHAGGWLDAYFLEHAARVRSLTLSCRSDVAYPFYALYSAVIFGVVLGVRLFQTAFYGPPGDRTVEVGVGLVGTLWTMTGLGAGGILLMSLLNAQLALFTVSSILMDTGRPWSIMGLTTGMQLIPITLQQSLTTQCCTNLQHCLARRSVC
jgi:hypothetical protein